MSEVRNGIYEGMFLFPQSAAADMRGVVDHVQSILERAGAELVAIQKWDERRLAYDIAIDKRMPVFDIVCCGVCDTTRTLVVPLSALRSHVLAPSTDAAVPR